MSKDQDRAFFGHPAGLSTLFFTEMWERFSYYGMRAFLILYLTKPITVGARGMLDAPAGAIVGMFGAAVYLLSLPGGWIADRFIGQQRAVTVGGIGIALGNAMLAIPSTSDLTFYPGLIMIAFGTGLLKPNVSTIVGQLYRQGDERRDSGYTIYYMGINIGATLSPLVCGWLAGEGLASETFRHLLSDHGIDPNLCWHVAFGVAALGMVGGLVQYTMGLRRLGEAGKHPTIPDDPARAARDVTVLRSIIGAIVALGVLVVVFQPSGSTIRDSMGIGLVLGSIALFYGLYTSARDASERRGILAMIPLYLGAIGFFGIFEQAPTTLSLFASDLTHRDLFGLNIPASYYQMVNGFFIVALAPAFAWVWLRMARAGREPTSVNKFAIGMIWLAVSFVVMLPTLATVPSAATEGAAIAESSKVSGMYLIALYFFYTMSELCISPVGLSTMSKLAPKRLAGMVMGTWFLGTSIGVYLAGRATAISAGNGYGYLFKFLIIASLVMAACLFAVAPMIRKMMAKNGVLDDSAAPLPEAKTISE